MTDLSTDFESYRISQSSASLRLRTIEWDLQAVRLGSMSYIQLWMFSSHLWIDVQSTYAVNHVISKTHPTQRQGTMAGNLQAEP
jgi:hypothetical protein